MSQSLSIKDGYQLVLTDTYLLHYGSSNFLRIPKSSIKKVHIASTVYTYLADDYTLTIDGVNLFTFNSKSLVLPAYNLITEWLLNDSVQPVLPTLEG